MNSIRNESRRLPLVGKVGAGGEVVGGKVGLVGAGGEVVVGKVGAVGGVGSEMNIKSNRTISSTPTRSTYLKLGLLLEQ
jgi:hypothetical protein